MMLNRIMIGTTILSFQSTSIVTSLFLTNESLRGSFLTYDSLSLPTYEVNATDMYVKIESEMHHNCGEAHGGFRSACWRSRNRHGLYRRDSIVSMENAKFMFYVTSLNLHHTESMNDLSIDSLMPCLNVRTSALCSCPLHDLTQTSLC